MKTWVGILALASMAGIAAIGWGGLSPAGAQDQGAVTVTKASGGPLRTRFGIGFVLNQDSSLEREWIAVQDRRLPAAFVGPAGVGIGHRAEEGYRYRTELEVECKEPLSAVEVRFLTFDVWGVHTRTLSLTEIADLTPGRHKLKGDWLYVLSGAGAANHYASIAFVARCRMRDGRVISADLAPVLAEAQKLSARFNAEDLEPEPEPKGSPASRT